MSKKKIILTGGLAALSFALAMGAAFMLPGGESDPNTIAADGPDANEVPPVRLSLQEYQIDELVRSLRQRIADCRTQAQQLNEREKQIRIVQDQLARQAEELEGLRVKAAGALATLREQQAALEAERIKIKAEDRANLKKTAAIYEKMESTAGGQILADMCRQNNEDDVVRILYYMGERPAAKIIESFEDRSLAARLCDKIKRVRESAS
jgi:hypothetical protein